MTRDSISETAEIDVTGLFSGKFEDITYFGGTTIGHRSENEDYFIVTFSTKKKFLVAVIADGMGGLDGGEIASKLAAENAARLVLEYFERDDNFNLIVDGYDKKVQNILKGILRECSAIVASYNKKNRIESGSTVVAAIIYEDNLHLAYAGDSRLYQFKSGGGNCFVTADHSPVGQMVRLGRITEFESLYHPMRNLISSFIGVKRGYAAVDAASLKLDDGDRILMCTDGICALFQNSEVDELLSSSDLLADNFEDLLLGAYSRGSTDNSTMVLLKYK